MKVSRLRSSNLKSNHFPTKLGIIHSEPVGKSTAARPNPKFTTFYLSPHFLKHSLFPSENVSDRSLNLRRTILRPVE